MDLIIPSFTQYNAIRTTQTFDLDQIKFCINTWLLDNTLVWLHKLGLHSGQSGN